MKILKIFSLLISIILLTDRLVKINTAHKVKEIRKGNKKYWRKKENYV